MTERAVLKNKWNLNKQGLDFLSKKSPGGIYVEVKLRAVHSVLRNLIRRQQSLAIVSCFKQNMCKLLNNFSMKLSMSRKRIGSTLSWHTRSWTHGTTIWGGLRDLEGPWELRESPPLPRPLSFLPPSPAPSSAFPIKVCILIVVVLIFKCLRQVLMAVVLEFLGSAPAFLFTPVVDNNLLYILYW